VTQRDQKTLMILILALAGAGVAFWLLQSWFLGPLDEYNIQIATLQDEVDKKEQQFFGVIRDKPLLEKAKARSLSANQTKAAGDYGLYLDTLLINNGLTVVSLTPPAPTDSKGAAPVAAGPNAVKKAGHTVLKYQVHAKGPLAAIVASLEELQRTPVLHRVTTLTIGRQESISAKDTPKDMLSVQMTIEAMIAAGAKPGVEPSLEPDTGLRLPTASNPRHYADIAKLNIFTGPVPPAYVPTEAVDPDEEIVPEYVRLVSTEPTSQEAFLRTLLFKTREIRLSSKPESGARVFQIWNEEHTKVLVRAQVLRVDQRDVYFQIKEDVYGIHIGDTIAHALNDLLLTPEDAAKGLSKDQKVSGRLSDAMIKRLDLTPLVLPYDPKTDPASIQKDNKNGSKTGKKRG
jgi:hypothetical protein